MPPLLSIARSANFFASTRLGRSTGLRAGYATSDRLVWPSLWRMRQLSPPSQTLKRHLLWLEVGDAYHTAAPLPQTKTILRAYVDLQKSKVHRIYLVTSGLIQFWKLIDKLVLARQIKKVAE